MYDTVLYIPGGIFRASFKFCMGDKLREKMEGVKRDVKMYITVGAQDYE